MRGIFLDTETNGLNWNKHHILEIALKVFDLDTGSEVFSYVSFVQLSEEEWKESNPESLNFNGIRWEEVKEAPKRSVIKKELLHLFRHHSIKRGSAVFICQNPAFDRVFFAKLVEVEEQERNEFPYTWLDLASMFWAKQIANGVSPRKIQLSKDNIAHFYGLHGEPKPHKADGGVNHLIACYEKVVGFPNKTTLTIQAD